LELRKRTLVELFMNESKTEHPACDARAAAMEARWDATLPTLATKSDVAALRADMHKWMTGTCIGLFVGFGGLFLAISNNAKTAMPPPTQAQPQLPPIIINVPPAPPPARER
jgi:hypothetical protein